MEKNKNLIKEPIFIPYGKSVHDQEEIDAVVSVLNSSTQMGQKVREMESKVSQLFSKEYGLMVNSGSSALYIAMEVLNFPKGSEVITPVLTFSTTVAALVKNDLVPVFIDAELETYNIDFDQIESQITEKTKAIMIPNLIGNFPDWAKIRELADKYNLIVIEDSADTIGGTIDGKKSGSFSDISITSFYGSHVVNCAGNGGMLCLNDEALYKEAILLRSWGRESSLFVDSENIENRFNRVLEGIEYDAKFVFSRIGYNLEPSEIGAAFGLVQLRKLPENITKREANYNRHIEFFKTYPEYFGLPKQLQNSRTAWLAFPVLVKESAPFSRKEFQIFLEKNNIQTRPVFTGNILRQPGFKEIKCIRQEEYPNADYIMKSGVLLGCHQGLGVNEIDYIHFKVKEFIDLLNK